MDAIGEQKSNGCRKHRFIEEGVNMIIDTEFGQFELIKKLS